MLYNVYNKYTSMDLEKFKDIRDKFESSYTIIINGLTVETIITTLHKKLDIVNTSKDNVKKKYLNDRIYSLIEHFNQFDIEKVMHNIYLLGKSLDIIPLSKDNIRILNEWQIPSFVFRYGEFFDIDYLNALLFDESYYDIINITNKKVIHTHLGKEKKKTIFDKEVSDFDLANYINENVKSQCLVHGISSIVKSFKPKNSDIIVFQKNLSDEQIIGEFQKQKMRKVHKKVSELIGHLQMRK